MHKKLLRNLFKLLETIKFFIFGWRPYLESYDELSALEFHSKDGVDSAIDLLWTKKLLRCPYQSTGINHTVIVPSRAVRYFQLYGLTFKVKPVVRSNEITSRELLELRKGNSIYNG